MNVRNLTEYDEEKLKAFLASEIAPQNDQVIFRQFVQRKCGDKKGYRRVIPNVKG